MRISQPKSLLLLFTALWGQTESTVNSPIAVEGSQEGGYLVQSTFESPSCSGSSLIDSLIQPLDTCIDEGTYSKKLIFLGNAQTSVAIQTNVYYNQNCDGDPYFATSNNYSSFCQYQYNTTTINDDYYAQEDSNGQFTQWSYSAIIPSYSSTGLVKK